MNKKRSYSAKDIEILKGLEPVRKRPGMYIGNTNEEGLHHLVSEVIDNSVDEVLAGFANNIEFYYSKDNYITIKDDGRGIPVDFHPKYKNKRALEVVLTTLHAGGKFNEKVYQTSGGLHGVGISVVNALSNTFVVNVYNKSKVYKQTYKKGKPINKISISKCVKSLKGTEDRQDYPCILNRKPALPGIITSCWTGMLQAMCSGFLKEKYSVPPLKISGAGGFSI